MHFRRSSPQEIRLASALRRKETISIGAEYAEQTGIAPKLLVTVQSLIEAGHLPDNVAVMLETGRLGQWPGRWSYRKASREAK